ncbi:MAG TPA: SRPBCC family protein [Gemmatimonadaceae bacterium]|nr:SRPBCC family protein [Gemmatimonadaceae bacterium]
MTKTMTHSTDRIEKTTLLRAPQARVWRALSDAKQFATWFGITLDEPFVVGRTVTGQLSMRGEQFTIEFAIDRIEPEHTFAYRWHPYAIDKNTDYSAEPMTLVEFRLKSVPEGTELTIIESGFDRIPAHRRDEAYRMNDGGWKSQIEKLRRHVES